MPQIDDHEACVSGSCLLFPSVPIIAADICAGAKRQEHQLCRRLDELESRASKLQGDVDRLENRVRECRLRAEQMVELLSL